MMDVEQPWQSTSLNASTVLAELLNECSAIMDYRTLRDSLPRRLAHLLQCRCVLLYQRIGETLQFAAGTFDDVPGWSASLLSVAHINPIDLSSDLPEAHAWRKRQATISPAGSPVPSLIAVPLIYRQYAIGVLVAFRNGADVRATRSAYQFAVSKTTTLTTSLCLPEHWSLDELPVLEAVAGVVALLLENTRLLERDQQRIAELSLLNSIANQLNYSMYDLERLQHIVVQHTREITSADLCTLLLPTTSSPSLPAWITPALSTLLFSRFDQQKDSYLTPLIIERPGNSQTMKYLNDLPTNIKTFFALPLFVNEATLRKDRYTAGKLTRSVEGEVQQLFQMPDDNGLQATSLQNIRDTHHSQVLGIVVGACYRARKLRREELVLLQVVVNQASIVLENIRLMSEVVEARNAARKLLRRVLDDVASMQHMEEEKRRLDRLASLGEMAASVAHEVRNPLASIKTSVQILKDDLLAAGSDEQAYAEAQESIEIVLQEVVRLDAIVRDLLLFAKPRQLHRIACNLTELSDHVLHMMRSQCAEMGVVVQRVYHNIPLIKIDMAQMEQVLFNLYMNAMQAMPDGGVLTITCQLIAEKNTSYNRTRQLTEKAIDFGKPIGVYGEQQQWLELVVSDTGTGIAPDQLERIFQPFFTTKAHGIGLGLPITRRLIEDHRGHMIIESKAGCGTTIAVRLPIEEEDASL